MTFGNRSMAALTQMKKLLGKRGVQLHYSNEVKMLDNYLPGYDITDQLKIHTDESIELKINDRACSKTEVLEQPRYCKR
jgi:hypothetical protein